MFLKPLGFSKNPKVTKTEGFSETPGFSKLQVFQNSRFKCNKTKVESDQLGSLLKSPIFVVQRAATPKNGVEFRQKSNGAIRCSVAIPYEDVRHRTTSVPLLTNQKFVVGGCSVIGFTKPLNYSRFLKPEVSIT